MTVSFVVFTALYTRKPLVLAFILFDTFASSALAFEAVQSLLHLFHLLLEQLVLHFQVFNLLFQVVDVLLLAFAGSLCCKAILLASSGSFGSSIHSFCRAVGLALLLFLGCACYPGVRVIGGIRLKTVFVRLLGRRPLA
jgi:hypothetical protein